MTHGTLEAASSSLSFVCPSACPLSPHCRAKNLFLPLLLQPWVLLALCGQAIPSPQLPPPTPISSYPLGKKQLPGKLWKQPVWGDAQGNCVPLLEGQCVPTALCFSARCWSKRGIGSRWEGAACAWGSGRASGKFCAWCPALTLALGCSR